MKIRHRLAGEGIFIFLTRNNMSKQPFFGEKRANYECCCRDCGRRQPEQSCIMDETPKTKAQKSGAGLPARGFSSGILPGNGFHLPAGRPFKWDK